MAVVDTCLPARSIPHQLGWAAFFALLALLVAAAYPSLLWMLEHEWFGSEEYSHGVLIPLLAAYFVRQRADAFALPGRGHAFGVAFVALGMAAVLIGNLSTIHTVTQYGFLIGVFGIVAATFGIDVLRRLTLPLLVLVFMIPLPSFLYQPLSGELQLVSSQLGVALIRAFGISVLLHGNVIDLGTYQLQVLEACNGLRYLFPLASLGYLFGYLYRGPTWQRVVLVAASVPITIGLNSFRIAVIGVTVEHWGTAAAEGFLHQFEGWAVFMVCVLCLLLVAKALARMRGYRGPLPGAFDTTLPTPPPQFRHPAIGAPWAVAAAMGLIALTIVLTQTRLHGETTVRLDRRSYAEFPLDLGGTWSGRREVLEQRYLDALQLDDYVMANYSSAASTPPVNFYSAFYASQLAGRSAHSPRSCLPGDGWQIMQLDTVELRDPVSGRPVPVNRVVIGRGHDTQLVYYWFEQRGRVVADEYLVKWYILVDALRSRRTDGALVRLITPVDPRHGIGAADAALGDVFARVKDRLPPFVPG
jgi:exosortase D (VPLPA-CTERM-specific)